MRRNKRLVWAMCLAAGAAPAQIRLQQIGTYATGIFDGSASEIEAYDPRTRRVFSANSEKAAVDVIDISNPASPRLAFSINVASYGLLPNSVDVRDGVVAVALDNRTVRTDPGTVAFFDTDGRFLSQVRVGAVPDKVAFTPDGRKVLVCNEGEPNVAYTIDPEGSVSIIDISRGAANVTQSDVRDATFREFTRQNIDPAIRISGLNASVAQDLEPEYVTISADSLTAWVSLQENNAIGILDIEAARFTRLVPLGFKDHSLPGNGLDGSDRDGGIRIRNWPLFGMYMPDGIASYRVGNDTYLLTANEGDTRNYEGFGDELRLSELTLDPTAFPNADELKSNMAIGRIGVSKTDGDTDGDKDYDKLYVFGARSFTIRRATGGLDVVYDSGDAFERITAATFPSQFNSDNDANNTFDQRSDNRGPEPEGVAVGQIGERTYAFVGIERMGGVMVYEITNPQQARFVQYINNRDFYGSAMDGTARDLGPEGVTFIRAQDSPDGRPLVVVSNEVSGTTTIYSVNSVSQPQVPAGGVGNGADYSRRVAPGSFISIFGAALAGFEQALFDFPLHTIAGDARVTMDGVDVPIYHAFPQQINAVVPYEMEGKTSASLQVTVAGLTSAAIPVALSPAAPAIFTLSRDGRGPGAILNAANGSVITASNPSARGGAVSIYATGLGSVTPTVASGAAAPSNPLARTRETPVVRFGNVEATVLFSGLAPGVAGLYQINVTVPSGAPTGDSVPVTIQIAGATSNTVTMAIQ